MDQHRKRSEIFDLLKPERVLEFIRLSPLYAISTLAPSFFRSSKKLG